MNENSIASVTALQALQRNTPAPFQPYAHEALGQCDKRQDRPLARVYRFTPKVIVGSPGTGKTRRLIALVGEAIAGGVRVQNIAYVAYSRAARDASLTTARLAGVITDGPTPWFRTVHSTARCLLDHPPSKLLTDAAWTEFAKRHGYTLSGLDEEEDEALRTLPCQTDDDLLRFAYDWGRNCCLTLEGTLARFPTHGLIPGVLRTYVGRLEAFKADHGLRDFTDLLEDALVCPARPPVEVAFIDEAQDLSPLQIALVEHWFGGCPQVYVAGDDDQAIYVHNGADPRWIRELASYCPVEYLTVSHRLPSAVLEYACKIIASNKDRVPKEVHPEASGGEVRTLDRDSAIELLDGSQSTFVLARNRRFLPRIAWALIERVVPFVVEGKGGPSPLSDPRLVRAVTLSVALRTQPDMTATASELAALLAYAPAEFALGRDRLASQRKFTRSELITELGLGPLLELIDNVGPLAPFQKLPSWKREYLSGLIGRFGTLPEPRITLTSIHASKGREADLVVVLSDMAKPSFHDYRCGGDRGFESENRVAYVAVTRAQKTLVIVDAHSRRHYDYPVPSANSPAAVRERWEERAAIREYEAGFDREAAESNAVQGGRDA